MRARFVAAVALALLGGAAHAKKPPPPAPKPAARAASSAVKLFERGRAPSILPAGFALPAAALRGRLDRGVAAQSFLGWLATQKARFGLKAVDADSLPLRGVHQTASGFSLRFVQRFSRIHIEEAELIALFGKDGRLRALSSSLVPTPAVSVRAELPQKDALRALAKRIDLEPLPKPQDDGLRLVRAGQKLQLAWRLSIYDRKEKVRAVALVAAAGASKGNVLHIGALDHSGVATRILDTGDLKANGNGQLNPPGVGTLLLDSGAQADGAQAFAAAHPSDWDDAQALQANLGKVLAFYSALGRSSWDNAGAAVVAYIREPNCIGNAMWSNYTHQFYFCPESPQRRTAEKYLDFVGHEFTHGVVFATSQLKSGGETGGLNEHLADMFGSMILHAADATADTRVWAAGFYKSGLPARNYLDPHQNTTVAPATMAELRAGEANGRLLARDRYMLDVEVHAQAAVPDRAIATAVQSIGWEKLTPVLYAVMTARLRADSGFDDYRDQLLDECAAQKPEICGALQAGFDLVGIAGHKPAAAAVASAPAQPAVTAGVR